ncbi:MAG: alpha,alpha-trehalose-phosphate synthase (UDP-forming), partial [Vicinamibacterales bacterium]
MNLFARLFVAASTGSEGLARLASAAASAVGATVMSIAGVFRAVDRRAAAGQGSPGIPDRQATIDGDAGNPDPWLTDPGVWTAARLKETLRTHLTGQRVLVVANREPLIHDWSDGRIVERHPASGLVTALEPVMRACSGVWIAHGSGTADQEAADPHGRVAIPTQHASYSLRRVWLTPGEERGYYYGFSNEALWPLCHLAAAQPVFRREDWAHYQTVNQRFADAVSLEADSDEPIVLVQDYHFALVPRMVRERFPRATILTFWHIPWPNAERFTICPYQDCLLDGLLGSSIVGFQTPLHCHNFLESVDRSLEARVTRDEMSVVRGGWTTAVRAYPISVEWPNRWLTALPSVEQCRRDVLAEHGLPADTRIIASVDRLDYTKGIEERLQTLERVLERWTDPNHGLAIIQVAAPSRTDIDQYRAFGDRVREQVDRINARLADAGRAPLVFLNRHVEPPEIARLYRAADVCYVSSLHDGMNLV